ncbi:helix-turn-helix domain-containing protein [Glutamicibacter ardleyensis]|uniref:helix-turn-helix domain-containing protein n=1 Tax=Glutamicibacter ardleyensis TaxID=225894 RepID=UPI003FD6262A
MCTAETESNYLTRPEAAAYLGIGTQTLANNHRRGPAYHKPFGRVLYAKADLDAWMKQQRVQPIGTVISHHREQAGRLRPCA